MLENRYLHNRAPSSHFALSFDAFQCLEGKKNAHFLVAVCGLWMPKQYHGAATPGAITPQHRIP